MDGVFWGSPNNKPLPPMDLIFNCPKCNQELEVDASGAGEEIDCPSCGERIRIPNAEGRGVTSTESPSPDTSGRPQPINAIASSAAAKIERHLKVPVRATGAGERLIAKALPPLEVAAKESDRHLRVKCIRHVDCVEVGHDRFDEVVTGFLAKIGDDNLVSITTISYSHLDISSQKLLTDYGVMIVYKG
jgi:DNA-directed RNA polymerase subunit RPC12/RpoP